MYFAHGVINNLKIYKNISALSRHFLILYRIWSTSHLSDYVRTNRRQFLNNISLLTTKHGTKYHKRLLFRIDLLMLNSDRTPTCHKIHFILNNLLL